MFIRSRAARFALLIAVTTTTPLHAADLLVPQQFASLTLAQNSATSGDRILVGYASAFTESDFSVNVPGLTIEATTPGFVLEAPEISASDVTLRAMSIDDLTIFGSGVAIEDCIVDSSDAAQSPEATLRFTRCELKGGHDGSPIAELLIEECTATSVSWFCDADVFRVVDSQFVDSGLWNSTSLVEVSIAEVIDCSFTRTYVILTVREARVARSVFTDATPYALGLAGGDLGFTVDGCVFARHPNPNNAILTITALTPAFPAPTPTLRNCTFVDNTSPLVEALTTPLTVDAVNTISWGNTGAAAIGDVTFQFTTSLIEGIDPEAPRFVDFEGGDYRLVPGLGSPGIDAGTFVAGASATDVRGCTRFANGDGIGLVPVIDIGAFESATPTLVAPGASIQAAVDAAGPCDDVVMLLPGDHTGFVTLDGDDEGTVLCSRDGADVTTIATGAASLPVIASSVDATIANLTFTSTPLLFRPNEGGALQLTGGAHDVLDCVFDGCEASNRGGAVLVTAPASPRFENCVFRDNAIVVADSFMDGGAAVAHVGGMPRYTNCEFLDNVAGGTSSEGGAINQTAGADTTFVNCLFAGNSASGAGAMQSVSSFATLTNCTVAGNEAIFGGGLINVFGGYTLRNTVISGNTQQQSAQFVLQGGATGDVAYSLIEDGLLQPGLGNLLASAVFFDPANDDYRLDTTSPGVDGGNGTSLPAGVDVDLLGRPRFFDVVGATNTGIPLNGLHVDMGAIENQQEQILDWSDLGNALAGASGTPLLVGVGTLLPFMALNLELTDALPLTSTNLVVGFSDLSAPFKGGVLVPSPDLLIVGLPTDALGEFTLVANFPDAVPGGVPLYFQHWIQDPSGPNGFTASNGVTVTTP